MLHSGDETYPYIQFFLCLRLDQSPTGL